MSWFRPKKSSSPIFLIEQDGRFGSAHDHTTEPIESSFSYVSPDFVAHERTMHTTVPRTRLLFIYFFFLSVFFLFFVRSAYLQIYRGEHYHSLADKNRYRTTRIVPPRGKILDRRGVVLATNTPSFLLTMKIDDLPKNPEEREKELKRVSDLSGVPKADIDLLLTNYTKRPHEEIPVLRNISHESAMRLEIELANFPGFNLIATTERSYPSAALSLSHVLGYAGKITAIELDDLAEKGYRPIDVVGKTGIEQNSEPSLRGTPGKQVLEVDAIGNELAVISKTDSIAGTDITLGIDLGFQKFIETRIQETLMANKATRGTVVASDPNTGEIRAIVSWPAFDNNLFAKGISRESYKTLIDDPDLPLFFRAISGEYPSGSVFKPVVAYAALQERIVSEHTSFLSSGGLRVGEWYFPDWKAGGHGMSDAKKAIAESVNTYFYIIGGGFDQTQGLGVERITDYARKFGFGSPTGIDLPGEQSGFLPSKEWKQKVKGERWYVGDTYHLAIGQGDFLTTPLQINSMTATIANNGIVNQPHLVLRNKSADKQTTPGTPLLNLDPIAMRIVRDGMRQTVLVGSARPLQSLRYPVAGKTGTAQGLAGRPTHAWFTGFGPFDRPTIAITILIEEGGDSFTAAIPLSKDLFAWWFQYGGGV